MTVVETENMPHRVLLLSIRAPLLQQLKDLSELDKVELVAATEGGELLELLASDPLDAVLVDMQPADGLQLKLLARLQRLRPDLPVLALSEELAFETVAQLLGESVVACLPLPPDGPALAQALRQALKDQRGLASLPGAEASARHRLEDLLLLQQALDLLDETSDPQQLLNELVKRIAQIVEVRLCSLMLVDEEGLLTIAAACGLPEAVVRSTRIRPGEGVSGHVLASGAALLVDDLSEDSRFSAGPGEVGYLTRSLLSVPLKCRGRVIGVLNVNNRNDGQTFDAIDLHLLTGIAHQAALAIENFRLLQQLQQKTGALEQAHAGLQRLLQGRSRLVCNLSHELKTPLTSVLGYIDLILNHFDQVDLAELQIFLERAREEGGRMKELINSMLTLFSIDSGGGSWNPEPVDLVELIGDALCSRTDDIEKLRLAVALSIADDLSPLEADRERLGCMVESLLDNAIKFNRPGGRLTLSLAPAPDHPSTWLRLAVHNDGGTVPAEAAETIFDQYTQLGDVRSGKPAGVGIGLSLCRAIVGRLGGRIFLDPPTGEGTTIVVLLPTHVQTGESTHDHF